MSKKPIEKPKEVITHIKTEFLYHTQCLKKNTLCFFVNG